MAASISIESTARGAKNHAAVGHCSVGSSFDRLSPWTGGRTDMSICSGPWTRRSGGGIG